MADTMHPPVDEYLEAILELEEEGARVIQARLADRLAVSAPSVSEMVRRLRAEGYLEVNPDRTLSMTHKGRDWATPIASRHRLAGRHQTDLPGLARARGHIQARRWEHVVSAEVEELIRAKLDNPTTCPHGNPIPGAGAPDVDVVLLSETQAGDAIRLERVSEELEIDHEALVYLDDHGFVPGVLGKVSTVAPDQTRLVTITGAATIAVGSSIANSLYVSLQPA